MVASLVPAQSVVQSRFTAGFIERMKGGINKLTRRRSVPDISWYLIDSNDTSLKIFNNTALQQYLGNLFSIKRRWTLTKWIAGITAEPAQNGLILFNNLLSCFSEIADQNCKSCSQSMHRGDAQTWNQRTGNWNWNTRTLSEAKVPLSRKISAEAYCHKWPSSTVLQLK